jgi:hypothetical protein
LFNLFKVEYFVEDKRLADSLRALSGLVRGLPSVVPVVNVEEEPHPSGLKAKTNGKLLGMFSEHVAKLDGPIKAAAVKEFLKSIGKSPGSSSYLIQQAIAARLVRRVGKSSATTYHPVKRLTHEKKGG